MAFFDAFYTAMTNESDLLPLPISLLTRFWNTGINDQLLSEIPPHLQQVDHAVQFQLINWANRPGNPENDSTGENREGLENTLPKGTQSLGAAHLNLLLKFKELRPAIMRIVPDAAFTVEHPHI